MRATREDAGKPVKMMLERNHELMGAGARPSLYARVNVAAKKDGTLIAWHSDSWGTNGPTGGAPMPLPYVFTKIPNRRTHYTSVHTNIGPSRAWRAPNHPQMCLVTMVAFDDLAAKLQMDPVEFLRKNLDLTARPEVYAAQLDKAAEMMDWKAKWHPRVREMIAGLGPHPPRRRRFSPHVGRRWTPKHLPLYDSSRRLG